LDEKRLLGRVEDGGLGYDLESLQYIATLLVPYGGLRDINLQAGETVIVAPATGSFGGAAVMVALAMGARVIAMGRKVDALRRIATLSDRVAVVPITGDVQVSTSIAIFLSVFFLSERSLQLGRVSDIPSKIYCHALALGVGFSHSEKTLLPVHS
jgi:hypothetical protein